MSLLLPHALRAALREQGRAQAAHRGLAEPPEEGAYDPLPLVKFFNPVGTATWLASAIGEDDDTLYGLADLGFGCPEAGCFSLAALARIRLPFGRVIERDRAFVTLHPLSLWARAAGQCGSILGAQSQLARLLSQHPDGPHANLLVPP
jgi:hypothetical protein